MKHQQGSNYHNQTPASAIVKNRNKLKEILHYRTGVKGLESQGIFCTIPRKTVGNVCGQEPQERRCFVFPSKHLKRKKENKIRL